jgi:hypothetical protein
MLATANLPELAIAFSVVLGALGTFITSLFSLKQAKQVATKVEEVATATTMVHTLVNNRSDKQDARIEDLTTALATSDTEIPPRRSNGP